MGLGINFFYHSDLDFYGMIIGEILEGMTSEMVCFEFIFADYVRMMLFSRSE